MLSIVIYTVEMIICFLLQSTVFAALNIGGIVPDIIVVVVMAAGYEKGKVQGLVMGIIGGTFMDIMFGEILGVYALGLMFIGYFCGFMNKYYIKRDTLLPLAMIAVSELAYSFYCYIVIMFTKGRLDFPYYLGRIILPSVCYTAIVGIVIFKLIDYIYANTTPAESEE